MKSRNKRHWIFCACMVTLCAILCLIDTGHNDNQPSNANREQVEILSVNNAQLAQIGIVNSGTQQCTVRILTGPHKGAQLEGYNHQNAALDKDKLFKVGDRALAAIYTDHNAPISAMLIDHYRVREELLLFTLFGVLLIIVGGVSGCGSLISLVLSVLVIWKLLIPLMLAGFSPILVSLGIVLFLTVLIDMLVAGISTVSATAIAGSFIGTLLTGVLAVVFGRLLKLDGGDLPYIVPLLSQSSLQLNIRELFFGMVFIANSGALMDLAMDIAAACYEVQVHSPSITRREMLKAGFSVSKNVTGTMTTTLFLAYSGSYLSMMMYFAGQGTPIIDLLNLKYIASEIMITLVGCFGLVTVAPFTSLMCSLIMCSRPPRTAEPAASEK